MADTQQGFGGQQESSGKKRLFDPTDHARQYAEAIILTIADQQKRIEVAERNRAAAEARVKELEALVADREGSYEFLQEINRSHVADLERAEAELKAARAALTEIAKGEGAFSRDPLTHASNTIDNMKSIAVKALKGEDK